MRVSEKQYSALQFQNLPRKAYFEGWYYKQVSRDERRALSIIPGLSKRSGRIRPFVQVIFGTRTENGWEMMTDWLDLDLFSAQDEPFFLRVGSNEFRRDGISIDYSGETIGIKGDLMFGPMIDLPSSFWTPTIMGPFSYLGGMECIHSVNSLSHTLEGVLEINGELIDFSGGKGYIEKDWGSSFPDRYVWLQSNHFREEGSLFFSWADIPVLGSSFEGYIAHLYYRGEHHRYATYTRGKVKLASSASEVKVHLTNAYSTLEISARQTAGAKLVAPHQGEMIHTIKEGLFGQLSFCFTRHGDKDAICDETEIAGIELVWEKGKL